MLFIIIQRANLIPQDKVNSKSFALRFTVGLIGVCLTVYSVREAVAGSYSLVELRAVTLLSQFPHLVRPSSVNHALQSVRMSRTWQPITKRLVRF